MSDPINPIAPTTPADGAAAVPAVGTAAGSSVGALSETQIASMKETWLASGFNAEAFDRALAADAALAPTQTDAKTADPDEQVEMNVGPAKLPRLKDEQAAEMSDALLRAGVPAEKIMAALRADGHDVDLADEASLVEQEHDAEWGYGQHYEPHDYKIQYGDAIRRSGAEIDPASLSALNNVITTGLANMQVDPLLGTGIAEHLMETGQRFSKMTPAERQLYSTEQWQLAEQRAGSPEKFAERLRLADKMFDLAGDEFKDLMRLYGVGSAWLIETLAHEGARLEGWLNGPRS